MLIDGLHTASIGIHSFLHVEIRELETRRREPTKHLPPSRSSVGIANPARYLANQPAGFLEKTPYFLQGIYHIGSRC